jgi:glycosyltransferase involved in cell wall biosynthesis
VLKSLRVDNRVIMLDRTDTRPDESHPKVGVILLTYNHEKWITQAVESVLMQKTSFDYEVTIVEDCSSDGTREKVIDFQQRFPERISLSLSSKNGEYRENRAAAFLASPSQYIALLDGDDYWTSPYKLQQQADFLDAHPECTLCFHNVKVFDEDGAVEPWYLNPSEQQEITGLEDLLVDNYIASCSPMFRNGVLDTFPEWYYAARWADWPRYILHAQRGKIGYLNEVMGARRLHGGGMWASLNNTQKVEQTIEFYRHIAPHLDSGHSLIVQGRISELSTKLTRHYRRRLRRKKKQLKAFQEALATERQKVRRLRRRSRRVTKRLQELDERPQSGVAHKVRGALRRVWDLRSRAVIRDGESVNGDGSDR